MMRNQIVRKTSMIMRKVLERLRDVASGLSPITGSRWGLDPVSWEQDARTRFEKPAAGDTRDRAVDYRD